MITCDVPPESSWPKEVKCVVKNADGTWVYCLLDAYKIQPYENGWAVKEEYAEEIRSLKDNPPFLQNPRFPGPAPEGDEWKYNVMTRSEPASGEGADLADVFDFPDAPVGGYSEEEIEAESRRAWALRWLAENLTVWPRSLNDPVITRGEDGDPASSEDFWWCEAWPGEPDTEIVLCCEKGNAITRLGWTKARESLAEQFDEPTPEEEEALREAEKRVEERHLDEIIRQGPGRIIEKPRRSRPDAHYQRTMRIRLTQEDWVRGYVEIKLDPYRLADFLEIGGGPREQVLKKTIRGTSKGHTELELIDDLRAAIDRWEQMILEGERIHRV